MAEQLILTVPQAGDVAGGVLPTGVWHVERFDQHRGWKVNGQVFTADPASSGIYIRLIGEYGRRREYFYTDTQADSLILALNRANLGVKSAERRILEQLIADGKEVGTITGAPD